MDELGAIFNCSDEDQESELKSIKIKNKKKKSVPTQVLSGVRRVVSSISTSDEGIGSSLDPLTQSSEQQIKRSKRATDSSKCDSEDSSDCDQIDGKYKDIETDEESVYLENLELNEWSHNDINPAIKTKMLTKKRKGFPTQVLSGVRRLVGEPENPSDEDMASLEQWFESIGESVKLRKRISNKIKAEDNTTNDSQNYEIIDKNGFVEQTVLKTNTFGNESISGQEIGSTPRPKRRLTKVRQQSCDNNV